MTDQRRVECKSIQKPEEGLNILDNVNMLFWGVNEVNPTCSTHLPRRVMISGFRGLIIVEVQL